MIGHKLYLRNEARKDKKVEVKRSVMTDTWRLGHLYCHFRNVNQRNASQSAEGCSVSVLDMFRRQYFNVLEEACATYMVGWLLMKIHKASQIYNLFCITC